MFMYQPVAHGKVDTRSLAVAFCRTRALTRLLCIGLSLAVGLPAGWGGALAQTTTTSAQPVPSTQNAAATTFKPEEIEALVAPIALYPDSVLSQVLMASTYPLEIVLCRALAQDAIRT